MTHTSGPCGSASSARKSAHATLVLVMASHVLLICSVHGDGEGPHQHQPIWLQDTPDDPPPSLHHFMQQHFKSTHKQPFTASTHFPSSSPLTLLPHSWHHNPASQQTKLDSFMPVFTSLLGIMPSTHITPIPPHTYDSPLLQSLGWDDDVLHSTWQLHEPLWLTLQQHAEKAAAGSRAETMPTAGPAETTTAIDPAETPTAPDPATSFADRASGRLPERLTDIAALPGGNMGTHFGSMAEEATKILPWTQTLGGGPRVGEGASVDESDVRRYELVDDVIVLHTGDRQHSHAVWPHGNHPSEGPKSNAWSAGFESATEGAKDSVPTQSGNGQVRSAQAGQSDLTQAGHLGLGDGQAGHSDLKNGQAGQSDPKNGQAGHSDLGHAQARQSVADTSNGTIIDGFDAYLQNNPFSDIAVLAGSTYRSQNTGLDVFETLAAHAMDLNMQRDQWDRWVELHPADSAMLSHDSAMLSHDSAMLSHDPAMLSHDPAMLSHNPAMLSHDAAMLSHDSAMLNHGINLQGKEQDPWSELYITESVTPVDVSELQGKEWVRWRGVDTSVIGTPEDGIDVKDIPAANVLIRDFLDSPHGKQRRQAILIPQQLGYDVNEPDPFTQHDTLVTSSTPSAHQTAQRAAGSAPSGHQAAQAAADSPTSGHQTAQAAANSAPSGHQAAQAAADSAPSVQQTAPAAADSAPTTSHRQAIQAATSPGGPVNPALKTPNSVFKPHPEFGYHPKHPNAPFTASAHIPDQPHPKPLRPHHLMPKQAPTAADHHQHGAPITDLVVAESASLAHGNTTSITYLQALRDCLTGTQPPSSRHPPGMQTLYCAGVLAWQRAAKACNSTSTAIAAGVKMPTVLWKTLVDTVYVRLMKEVASFNQYVPTVLHCTFSQMHAVKKQGLHGMAGLMRCWNVTTYTQNETSSAQNQRRLNPHKRLLMSTESGAKVSRPSKTLTLADQGNSTASLGANTKADTSQRAHGSKGHVPPAAVRPTQNPSRGIEAKAGTDDSRVKVEGVDELASAIEQVDSVINTLNASNASVYGINVTNTTHGQRKSIAKPQAGRDSDGETGKGGSTPVLSKQLKNNVTKNTPPLVAAMTSTMAVGERKGDELPLSVEDGNETFRASNSLSKVRNEVNSRVRPLPANRSSRPQDRAEQLADSEGEDVALIAEINSTLLNNTQNGTMGGAINNGTVVIDTGSMSTDGNSVGTTNSADKTRNSTETEVNGSSSIMADVKSERLYKNGATNTSVTRADDMNEGLNGTGVMNASSGGNGTMPAPRAVVIWSKYSSPECRKAFPSADARLQPMALVDKLGQVVNVPVAVSPETLEHAPEHLEQLEIKMLDSSGNVKQVSCAVSLMFPQEGADDPESTTAGKEAKAAASELRGGVKESMNPEPQVVEGEEPQVDGGGENSTVSSVSAAREAKVADDVGNSTVSDESASQDTNVGADVANSTASDESWERDADGTTGRGADGSEAGTPDAEDGQLGALAGKDGRDRTQTARQRPGAMTDDDADGPNDTPPPPLNNPRHAAGTPPNQQTPQTRAGDESLPAAATANKTKSTPLQPQRPTDPSSLANTARRTPPSSQVIAFDGSPDIQPLDTAPASSSEALKQTRTPVPPSPVTARNIPPPRPKPSPPPRSPPWSPSPPQAQPILVLQPPPYRIMPAPAPPPEPPRSPPPRFMPSTLPDSVYPPPGEDPQQDQDPAAVGSGSMPAEYTGRQQTGSKGGQASGKSTHPPPHQQGTPVWIIGVAAAGAIIGAVLLVCALVIITRSGRIRAAQQQQGAAGPPPPPTTPSDQEDPPDRPSVPPPTVKPAAPRANGPSPPTPAYISATSVSSVRPLTSRPPSRNAGLRYGPTPPAATPPNSNVHSPSTGSIPPNANTHSTGSIPPNAIIHSKGSIPIARPVGGQTSGQTAAVELSKAATRNPIAPENTLYQHPVQPIMIKDMAASVPGPALTDGCSASHAADSVEGLMLADPANTPSAADSSTNGRVLADGNNALSADDSAKSLVIADGADAPTAADSATRADSATHAALPDGPNAPSAAILFRASGGQQKTRSADGLTNADLAAAAETALQQVRQHTVASMCRAAGIDATPALMMHNSRSSLLNSLACRTASAGHEYSSLDSYSAGYGLYSVPHTASPTRPLNVGVGADSKHEGDMRLLATGKDGVYLLSQQATDNADSAPHALLSSREYPGTLPQTFGSLVSVMPSSLSTADTFPGIAGAGKMDLGSVGAAPYKVPTHEGLWSLQTDNAPETPVARERRTLDGPNMLYSLPEQLNAVDSMALAHPVVRSDQSASRYLIRTSNMSMSNYLQSLGSVQSALNSATLSAPLPSSGFHADVYCSGGSASRSQLYLDLAAVYQYRAVDGTDTMAPCVMAIPHQQCDGVAVVESGLQADSSWQEAGVPDAMAKLQSLDAGDVFRHKPTAALKNRVDALRNRAAGESEEDDWTSDDDEDLELEISGTEMGGSHASWEQSDQEMAEEQRRLLWAQFQKHWEHVDSTSQELTPGGESCGPQVGTLTEPPRALQAADHDTDRLHGSAAPCLTS